MGVGAQERLLGQVGDIGRRANACSDEISNPALIMLDQQRKRVPVSASYLSDEPFVGSLFDDHLSLCESGHHSRYARHPRKFQATPSRRGCVWLLESGQNVRLES